MNFFDVLGVPQDASLAEIKAAYKKLAFQLHPDRNHDPDAAIGFQQVAEAYGVLKDPIKRQEYSREVSLSVTSDPMGYLENVWTNLISSNIQVGRGK